MDPPNKIVGAVIPAAGSGQRFGELKQFKLLGKRPLLYATLTPFLQSSYIAEIVVAVPQDTAAQVERELLSIAHTKSVTVIPGGNRRQDSVLAGVRALSPECELVCIHDAVRPFVTEQMLQDSIRACEDCDGAIVAVRARDTIKQADGSSRMIKATVDRRSIWQAQTPQTFHRDKLEEALEAAVRDDEVGTDEAYFMERIGCRIALVEGSPENIKITTPEDWIHAEAIWEKNHG